MPLGSDTCKLLGVERRSIQPIDACRRKRTCRRRGRNAEEGSVGLIESIKRQRRSDLYMLYIVSRID